MKKKILLTSVIIAALLTTKTSIAQLKYGFALSGGMSNINVVQKDKHTRFGNYFTASTQAAFELFVSEKLKSKPISFEQGISVETFAAKQNIPKKDYEDILLYYPNLGPRVSELRSWQLAIPLKVKYEANTWLSFFAGVNNIFFINNNKIINHKYTLRGEVGADFLLANRFILGLEGGYDILPSGQFQDDKIFFHYYHVSAKVGILLSSLKK